MFIKKLKSIFILEDEGETKKVVAKAQEKEMQTGKSTKANEAPTVSAHDITIDVSNTTPPPGGKPDSKFVNILLKAVEKQNLEGFDYLEYKSSLQSLKGMDMDDATRYKSALAMATTMGATPKKLISTAKEYLNVLETEKSKFQEALKGQTAKQVTGKEANIKKMVENIEKKKQRILQLQKEIEADTQKMETSKKSINASVAKVQKTSDSFHYAYNVVSGQIISDIENMESYL